jgi:hypothetical protein
VARRKSGSDEPTHTRTAHLVPIERWPAHLSAGDPPDTHEYLCRLFGIVAKVSVSESKFGPRVRLYGELIARRPDERCEAPIVLVPTVLAEQVSAVFAAHPPHSTRDRVRVWIDFDVWVVKSRSLLGGLDFICDGQAWIPEPLRSLESSVMVRGWPKSPRRV